jgi:hypothetical protein
MKKSFQDFTLFTNARISGKQIFYVSYITVTIGPMLSHLFLVGDV